jgi:hypothetical protein
MAKTPAEVVFFPVDHVVVGERARSLNQKEVARLADSIRQIGLQVPISVRIVPELNGDGTVEKDVPILVVGLHRLEAAKSLCMDTIACVVANCTETEAKLWEIDENLCRAELTELERDEHLLKRKQIYEQLHPETKQGGLPGAPGGGKTKAAKSTSFVAQTANKTKTPQRTIRRRVSRAVKIAATVRNRIRNKPEIADKGVELDALASIPKEDQNRAVDLIDEGRAANVRDARKKLLPHPDPSGELDNDNPEKRPVEEREAGAVEAVTRADARNYPDIDPYAQQEPLWMVGALQLLDLLVPAVTENAVAAQDVLPNWSAIIDGAVKIIPPLTEAALESERVPQPHQLEKLLRYCGWGDLADRVLRYAAQYGEVTARPDALTSGDTLLCGPTQPATDRDSPAG